MRSHRAMEIPVKILVSLLLLCALTVALPLSAEEEEEATIDSLFLGEYWFGAQIEDEDLVGKVVLFEIWGS